MCEDIDQRIQSFSYKMRKFSRAIVPHQIIVSNNVLCSWKLLRGNLNILMLAKNNSQLPEQISTMKSFHNVRHIV
jgi:hypothetical protein